MTATQEDPLDRMQEHIDVVENYLRSAEQEQQSRPPIQGGGASNWNENTRPSSQPTSNLDKAKKAAKTYQKARNDRTVGPYIQQGEHFLKERVEKGIGQGLAKVFRKIKKPKETDTFQEPGYVKKAFQAGGDILSIPGAIIGAAAGFEEGGSTGAALGAQAGFKEAKDLYGNALGGVFRGVEKSYYEELNRPAKAAEENRKKQIKQKQEQSGGSYFQGTIDYTGARGGKITPIPSSAPTSPTQSMAPKYETPAPSAPDVTPSLPVSRSGTTQFRDEIGPPVVRDATPRQVYASTHYTPQFIGASGFSGATPYYNYGYGKKTRRSRVSRKRPAKGSRRSSKRLS